jgi:hypothetical protein
VSKFIWANHNELINLEAVSMIRLLVDDNMAHAFFPGSDKPILMNGAAALSLFLTKPNTSGTIKKPASLRSENRSPSARNAVRVPFGISVRQRAERLPVVALGCSALED